MAFPRVCRWSFAALAVALTLPSCSIRRAAKSAAQGSVDAAAERATQPGPSPVGSAVGRVLDDPSVKQAVRGLASEGVVGAAEGVQRSKVVQQISPQIEGVIRGAIAGSLRDTARSLQSEGRDDLDAVTGALSESTAHSVAGVLNEQHPSGLSPALSGFMRTASREAVVGAGEGVRSLEPIEDATLQRKIYEAGYVFGSGFGEGMPRGMARSDGLLLLLSALVVAVGLLGGAAIYALWRQNQATSKALLLLAQRLEGPRAEPSPASSRRFSVPPQGPSPSAA